MRNKFLIPHNFKYLYSNENLLNLKSTRACYGLRLGLLISVSFFIVHFFNIPFGDWAVYTIFALCQPHFEYTITKSKKRIFGTIIGAVSITILFNIFTDPMIRTVILLISGYLMAFMSDYRNSVIFTTICAVAASTVTISNPNPIIFSRIMFVIIGIILSVIANKYILPGSLKDEEDNINNIQKMSSTKLLENILNDDSYKNTSSIKILSLIPALIDLRIDHLNINGLDMEKDYLEKNKILMNDVYMIHLLLKHDLNYYLAVDTVKKILLKNDTVEVMKVKVNITLDYTTCVREKFILYKFRKMLDSFSKEWLEDSQAYELSTVLN